MFYNQEDSFNDLEKTIVQILRKNGVLNSTHEFGIVLKQLSPTSLLVASQHHDKNAEEIPCAQMEKPYRAGDRVLVEYLNGSAHNKFVIATIQKGAEEFKPDYSQLKDTPVRIFRRMGNAILDNHGFSMDDISHPPPQLTWKLLYDEGSTLEWWEILNRDSNNRVTSITTYYPPKGAFVFTNYIVRDEEGWFKYYGPNPNA